MIVVSNTSPLTNLAAIKQLELLRALYGHIHVPTGVREELSVESGASSPGSSEIAAARWIEYHSVQNQALVHALQRDLDRGESEAIALGVELGAGLVLMDEKEGRRAACRIGLRVVGVVGVLLDAKSKRLMDMVRPQLDSLRQNAGFYLSDAVYQLALRRANEA
ncbi:MAG: DUF3368 domain-containing protein [Acidobacteria bacterium]|nr:DUF3368 domain-containing protein [Acidobacteriota bacterium]